jgi:glycine/D-amino acid oxidase-like deaminating enzyme
VVATFASRRRIAPFAVSACRGGRSSCYARRRPIGQEALVTRTESLWAGTHQLRRFPPLSREITVDVLVIGGGVTGVTAAVLLARAGRDVVLIDEDRIGTGETGRTTSHLTEAVDARYQRLEHDFGRDAAALVAQSNRTAIDRIEQFVQQLAIPCGFARVPGYFYSERESDLDLLVAELDAAQRAGCAAEWVDEVPLPFPTVGGIRWHNQAQVHPTSYLSGLVEDAVGRGLRIYEETQATDVDDGEPCVVHTNRFDIRAREVFVAANLPVHNRVSLPKDVTVYRSYAEAIPWTAAGAGGLFWDTDDPPHHTRTQEAAGRTYLIAGGENHRLGKEEDTDACVERLSEYRRSRFGGEEPRYRWSGQIIEPVDGLPYIGRNSGAGHVYAATGYAGNGMTYGTLAAMVVTDLILGRENSYAALYDPTRVKPVAPVYGRRISGV